MHVFMKFCGTGKQAHEHFTDDFKVHFFEFLGRK